MRDYLEREAKMQAEIERLTVYAGRLKAALKKLREDEWRATIDWGPRAERDVILEEVDALLAEEKAPELNGVGTEPRFFIDHGVVHDRKTGQHVGMEAEPGNPQRLLDLLQSLEAKP